MNSIPIPGYLQCEWLLSDFRNATANELKAALLKSESDLLRMSRKAIGQSPPTRQRRTTHTTQCLPRPPQQIIHADDLGHGQGSPLARGAPSAQGASRR